MNISLHGHGHKRIGRKTPKPQRNDHIVNIGMFRRGGLGDGVIQSALLTAVHRKFPSASITGYADDQFYELILEHPSCCSVKPVPWTADLITEVHVRNEYIPADGLDLWFDVKPVPYIEGRAKLDVVDSDVLDELSDIESRYYRFNGDEIVDFYKQNQCRGQLELFSKLFGIKASITDAYISTAPPSDDLTIPQDYVTVGAGWTDTSRYKGWTQNGWNAVARWLNEQGICPVQVGLESEPRIDGASSALHLPLEQQLFVISGAIAHGGSDGFLCHASTAMNVPTVVLWGPTPPEVWGHSGQYDVISPDAKNIWWSHYHWGWNDECTHIMYAIKPDQVITEMQNAIDGDDDDA